MSSTELNSTNRTAEETNKPKRRATRDWTGATLALIIGLLGLIGGRLGYLWIGFDVFSQFSLQFILLAMAASIGIAMPRYKGLVAFVLFTAMVAGYSAWPHVVSSKPAEIAQLQPGESKLKVASFNTLVINQNYDALAASILKMDADVITLIEIDSYKAPVLAALKSTYPYQYECGATAHCEMAILSKFPMTDVAGKGIWKGPGYISAKLGAEFGNTTVFSVHTTRFPHSRAQFTQINAFVKELESVVGRVIVMGDLNSTPFSRINQTLSSGAGLTRLTNLPTWPATYGLPQLAIDHIFVSEGIRSLSKEQVGDNAGSDHFPIIMTLAIPKT